MNSGWPHVGAKRALADVCGLDRSHRGGRIAAAAPPRPQGIERNVVITEWDWGTPKEYFHDEISTDRRNPTINANGLIYGVHEVSTDFITVLDPVKNTSRRFRFRCAMPDTPYAAPQDVAEPSPYWGDEPIWNGKANVHSLMMDSQGRIWTAASMRAPETIRRSAKRAAINPSAKLFPLDEQLAAGQHVRSEDRQVASSSTPASARCT